LLACLSKSFDLGVVKPRPFVMATADDPAIAHYDRAHSRVRTRFAGAFGCFGQRLGHERVHH
jgi:hypothetical protein